MRPKVSFKKLNPPSLNPFNNEISIIITPFGEMPVLEEEPNIWVTYTNFNITEEMLETIDKTEGIEALTPLTRYKMSFIVGQLFDDKETRLNVNRILYDLFREHLEQPQEEISNEE